MRCKNTKFFNTGGGFLKKILKMGVPAAMSCQREYERRQASMAALGNGMPNHQRKFVMATASRCGCSVCCIIPIYGLVNH